MKKLLAILTAIFTAIAALVALIGLWANVILDGLGSNTCTAFALTAVIFGVAAWGCFLAAIFED